MIKLLLKFLIHFSLPQKKSTPIKVLVFLDSFSYFNVDIITKLTAFQIVFIEIKLTI